MSQKQELRMAAENLVDAFEQVLGVARYISCELKPGVYAACALEQEGIPTEEKVHKVMCASCRALWHLQLGKDLWVRMVRGLPGNKKWDPYRAIPPEDRVDPGIVPSPGDPVSE